MSENALVKALLKDYKRLAIALDRVHIVKELVSSSPVDYTPPEGSWAWACERLLEGKSVRRASWANVKDHVYIKHSNYIYSPYTGNVMLHKNCLTAVDWVVVDAS